MAIDVSKSEYKEFKRLVQKVNRRIKAHQQSYAKRGIQVIPKSLTSALGGIQSKGQYQAGKLTPLSRGLSQFNTKKEFDKAFKRLEQMSDNKKSTFYMPTVKEYSEINRNKLFSALNTMGLEVDPSLQKRLNKMNSADLSLFWDNFGKRAARKGQHYSSDAVMLELLEDFTSDYNQALKRS